MYQCQNKHLTCISCSSRLNPVTYRLLNFPLFSSTSCLHYVLQHTSCTLLAFLFPLFLFLSFCLVIFYSFFTLDTLACNPFLRPFQPLTNHSAVSREKKHIVNSLIPLKTPNLANLMLGGCVYLYTIKQFLNCVTHFRSFMHTCPIKDSIKFRCSETTI